MNTTDGWYMVGTNEGAVIASNPSAPRGDKIYRYFIATDESVIYNKCLNVLIN